MPFEAFPNVPRVAWPQVFFDDISNTYIISDLAVKKNKTLVISKNGEVLKTFMNKIGTVFRFGDEIVVRDLLLFWAPLL